MSHEYTPRGANIANDLVRAWRQDNYDSDVLHGPNSKLSDIMAGIDTLMAASTRGRSYTTDDSAITHSYKRLLYDDETHVLVQAEHRVPMAHAYLREEYSLRLKHYDGNGNFLFGSAYSMGRLAVGFGIISVRQSVEGTAAALEHDDEAFARAIIWRPATIFDVAALLPEIESLINSQKNVSAMERTLDSVA